MSSPAEPQFLFHHDIHRYLITKLGNKAIGSVNESGVNAAHVAASVGQSVRQLDIHATLTQLVWPLTSI